VYEALTVCGERGKNIVVVLRDSAYYRRFGSSPELAPSLRGPFSSAGDAWMALELVPGTLEGVTGTVECPEGEDVSHREKCNSQDQRMAVWFILIGTRESKTEIPADSSELERGEKAMNRLSAMEKAMHRGMSFACWMMVVAGQLPAQGGTWVIKAPMPTARRFLAAAEIGGRLYAVGGYNLPAGFLRTLEVYDPGTNTWSTKAPMPTARDLLAAATLGGKLYVVGGTSGGASLSVLEVYDPLTDTWTTKASMPTARNGLAAAALNNMLYVVGGFGGPALSTLEAYDPVSNSWIARAPMSSARGNLAAAAVNGKLYAVGGGPGCCTWGPATLEVYDPASNTWMTAAPRPTTGGELWYLAATELGGMLYAVGGGFPSAAMHAYAPSTDTWQAMAPMPTARWGLATAALGGALYAVGGTNFAGNFATLEVYIPPSIAVSIDVKPGSFPNSINLGSGGTVPVAIFSTTTFDARTVNPATVTLAGASVKLKGQGTPMASFQDVNGDGLLDLVVHVSTDALQLSETDTEVVLEGQTFSGTAIRGVDTVRVVP
jgi:N-acetylneuraminic acid mutarotase